MTKNKIGVVPLILGYVFLYTPLVVLMFFSFNASQQVTVWTGFSLRWFCQLFKNQELFNAFWTSLKIASMSASLSTILGTLAAFLLKKKSRLKGKALLQILTIAPLVMPEMLMGLAFLMFFLIVEGYISLLKVGTIPAITIAHTTLSIAYVSAIVQSQLSHFDGTLIEAAMDLGARPLRAFLSITLPILLRSLISGWLLSFVLSMDDLLIASFIGGPSVVTLPTLIYASVKFGTSPEINALATLMILFIFVSLFGMYFFHAHRKK